MADFAAAFAEMAAGFSAIAGGPYSDAVIVDPGSPEMDDGGSIVTPAVPRERPCKVQIDSATEAMRQADGYTAGDVRFLILSASITGNLGTDATVRIDDGPFVGEWLVSSIERDPVAIGHVGRGRRA